MQGYQTSSSVSIHDTERPQKHQAHYIEWETFNHSLKHPVEVNAPLPTFQVGGGVAFKGATSSAIGRSSSLVTTLISQKLITESGINLFPRMAKLILPTVKSQRKGGGVRGKIDHFSWASKSRLRDVAENSWPPLISTVALTYHNTVPDGRTSKKHLNRFLTEYRNKYPGSTYVWVLEFQKRGVPHYHVYFSIPFDAKGFAQWIGESWHRIAEPDSHEHLSWHIFQGEKGWEGDNRKKKPNCRPWEMVSGGYLCKYLDKDRQKQVPDGYTGIGRFWGASRAIIPLPVQVSRDTFKAAYDIYQTDFQTGEVTEFDSWRYLLRTLDRHRKKSFKKKYKNKFRVTKYRNGHKIYQQIEKFLDRQKSRAVPF